MLSTTQLQKENQGAISEKRANIEEALQARLRLGLLLMHCWWNFM